MKLRKYEKMYCFMVMVISLFLIEIIFFSKLVVQKIPIYENLQGVVQKDNVINVIIDQRQLNLFYKNHYIYVGNKKIEFQLRKVVRGVLRRNKKEYHEVVVEFCFDEKRKENDVLDISIQKDEIRAIEIFKIIWKGDT